MSEATQVQAPVQTPVIAKKEPYYDEFFLNHPVGWNKKQVLLDFTDSENNPIQITVTFTWQAMQCTYVHASTCYDRRDLYVGTIDLFNHTVWETPNSLTRSAEISMQVRKFVRSFRANRHKEFFKVTWL